jgi:hypothetical protein
VPDKTVMIAQYFTSENEIGLLLFLDKNSNAFAWKTSNLWGVSRSIIEHKLHINPSAKPRMQKLHKMSYEKIAAAKVEVQRLLDACLVREVQYPSWLANVVMVK